MKKIGKSSKNDGLSWVSHHFPSIFPGPAARLAGAPPLPPRQRRLGGARRGAGGAVESARLALSKVPAWEMLTAALEAFEAGGVRVF